MDQCYGKIIATAMFTPILFGFAASMLNIFLFRDDLYILGSNIVPAVVTFACLILSTISCLTPENRIKTYAYYITTIIITIAVLLFTICWLFEKYDDADDEYKKKNKDIMKYVNIIIMMYIIACALYISYLKFHTAEAETRYASP
jgi:hypothetical protein